MVATKKERGTVDGGEGRGVPLGGRDKAPPTGYRDEIDDNEVVSTGDHVRDLDEFAENDDAEVDDRRRDPLRR